MTVYTQLTSEIITSWFLYGKETPPTDLIDESIVRPEDAVSEISVSTNEYMENGAGRFARPSMSPLTKKFFSYVGEIPGVTPGVEYTKAEMASLLNLDSIWFSYNQYEYDDGLNDYASRTYIWNTSAFKLSDDVRFVVDPITGERYIKNASVVPYSNFENFDFVSSDPIASLSNPYLEENTDPSAIGRTVEITLSGDGSSPVDSRYTFADYQADLNVTDQNYVGPLGKSTLVTEINQLLDGLYNSGVTKFLYDGKAVVFGDNTGTFVDVGSKINSYHDQASDNGIVFVGTDKVDKPISSDKPITVYSLAGEDELRGTDGDDIFFAGKDNDTVLGGLGSDVIHGGAEDVALENDGSDTADYHQLGSRINISTTQQYEPDGANLKVEKSGDGQDKLYSIEKIIGTQYVDTLTIDHLLPKDTKLTIENLGGTQGVERQTVIDASGVAGGVDIQIDGSGNGFIKSISGAGEEIKLLNFKTTVESVVKGTSSADIIIDKSGSRLEVDGGAGDDEIETSGILNKIYAGAGDDTIYRAGAGTEISTGEGSDIVFHAADVLITDASETDQIWINGKQLHGGYRDAISDVGWAYDTNNVRYAVNTAGELIIYGIDGAKTFVANYDDGIGAGLATAGVTVFEVIYEAHRLLADGLPKGWLSENFNTLDLIWKAMTGTPRYPGADPLVLDLDGDGLELTAQTATSTLFDLDGDNFAERSGWVYGDDGFLVRDLNADGIIDDISEFFGSPTTSGFAALSALDSNLDNVIDASDTDFSTLLVWRDANNDGITDAGELLTLSEAGVASISLASTAQTDVLNAGNEISATSSFTRTDGTTSTIADVNFRVDQYHTEFLGDTTISPDAALLPEIRGRGTLPDLRVSMTLDPTFRTVVENNLPNLNQTNIEGLRQAAAPILYAWGAGGSGHSDVPVLYHTDENGKIIVDDFGILNASGYWELASGDDVHDAQGQVIAEPTMADLLAITSGTSAWRTFSSADFAFMERYLGEEVPVGKAPSSSSSASELNGAVTDFLEFMFEQMNIVAVRLAAQGPLSSFLSSISYDVEMDGFVPNTDRQLIPVYEAILGATPGDASAAATYLGDWKPILDVIIGDYHRGEAHLTNTYSFLFSNVVAAFESTGSPLDIVGTADALGIPSDLIVAGSAGDLNGTDENDIFYLNGGNQTARGGLGHDVYVIGKNFGTDIIDEVELAQYASSTDLIRFADIASTEVTATRVGVDLIITVDATGDQLTVLRQFEGKNPGLFGGSLVDDTGVMEIIFADGVVWDRLGIAEAVSHPTSADETIIGTSTIDFLDGGAGNDRLEGGDDGDVYRFGIGYGDDIVYDYSDKILVNAPDYVQFLEGFSYNDVTFSRTGNSLDLVIEIPNTTDRLTIENQFDSAYTGVFGQQWFSRIELFSFADGFSYGWQEIITDLLINAKTDADDTIYGFDLEDTLDGGIGNDFLSGGNENDTYIYGAGYGADLIYEDMGNILSGQLDRIVFQEGFTAEDLIFSRFEDSDDLVITFSNGETGSLTVQDQFVSSYTLFGLKWFDTIETVEFVDTPETYISWDEILVETIDNNKTDGDDRIFGFNVEDTLDGGAGNDYLSGGNESDTYIFGLGYGSDIFDDGFDNILSERFDIVQLLDGITSTDLSFSRSTDFDDLIVSINGTSDQFTIADQYTYGSFGGAYNEIEEFHFADGSILTEEQIRDILLQNTAGDDTLVGFRTNDVLDGGLGNDRLEGGDGSDTYVFDAGYGNDTIAESVVMVTYDSQDVVSFGSGISAADVTVERQGTNIVLSFAGLTDTLTLEGQLNSLGYNKVEELHFEDGTVWTEDDLISKSELQQGTSGDDVMQGTIIKDVIEGLDGNDEIYADKGADTLDGGLGDDRLEGGDGADTYLFNVGYGNDIIKETTGIDNDADKVVFGSGITAANTSVERQGEDIVLSFAGTTDTLTVERQLSSLGYFVVEEFHFDDGTIWTAEQVADMAELISGTSGDDVLNGSVLSDTIEGLEGNDEINAGDGDDTLIGGLGNDLLKGNYDSDTYIYNLGDGSDTISDHGNSSTTDIDSLVFGTGLNASDLIVTRSTADSYDVSLEFTGVSGTITLDDQFVTTDGTREIDEFVFGDNTTWSAADLRAAYLAQASTDGNDTIVGFWLDDTLSGGLGDDTIEGSYGSDTYIYNLGDGDDYISDRGYASSTDFDRLIFGTGISASDVIISSSAADSDDVVLTFSGSSGSITLDDQLLTTDGNRGIEEIEFSDGTIWQRSDIAPDDPQSADTIGDTAGTAFILGSSISHASAIDFSGDRDWYEIVLNAGTAYVFNLRGAPSGVGTLSDTKLWLRDASGAQVAYDDDGGVGYESLIQFNATQSGTFYLDVAGYSSQTGSYTLDIEQTIEVGDTVATAAQYGIGSTVAGEIEMAGDHDWFEIDLVAGSSYEFNMRGAPSGVGTLTDSRLWLRDAAGSQLAFDDDGGVGYESLIQFTATQTGTHYLDAGAYSNRTGTYTLDVSVTKNGTAGDDTLISETFSDILTGGTGDDTFHFDENFGLDQITDFTAGAATDDVIEFDSTVYTDFTSVMADAYQDGGNTVIEFDAANKITLNGVTLTDLHQDDFRFV